MLDSAVSWGDQAQKLLMGYANFSVNEHKENLAYNEILTNPDVLSDYTLEFFGPQGPYPVYESQQELETPGYPTAPVGQQVLSFLVCLLPRNRKLLSSLKISGVPLSSRWIMTPPKLGAL